MYQISFPFDREDLESWCDDQPLGPITEEQMTEIIGWAEDYLAENDLGHAMRFAVEQVLGVTTP